MSVERDHYRGDVWYEAWRRGLPEGAISDDRIDDAYDTGVDSDRLVQREVERRRSAIESQEWWEEEARELEGPGQDGVM